MLDFYVILTVCCVLYQSQYRLLYEAMKEFLNRPDAFVLGRDCRAFPPTSSTPRHAAETAQTGAGPRLATSPGNSQQQQQVPRGPWRTPVALGTPPDRAAYGAAGNDNLYRSTLLSQWRGGGPYPRQAVGDAGGYAARYAADRRPGARDGGAQLNVSMNRATSAEEPGTQSVTSPSSSDVKQRLTPPLPQSSPPAAEVTDSSLPTAATPAGPGWQLRSDSHLPQPGHQSAPTATANDRPTTVVETASSSSRRHQPKLATSSSSAARPSETQFAAASTRSIGGPLTSTPLDHDTPARHE